MAENLVIVESPAKAKTIKKYLGRDFDVLASYGHVRDLVPKEGAVDPDDGYAMKYRVLEKNERHVEAIARSLRKSKALYLATDPDREGEAIAWHLKELLKERGDLDGKDVHRVVFYEITKNAIREAVGKPRGLSLELVNAQQARRALDYLVGFNLSPLLWKKVRQGLSAGRVQSPALRMICEREAEIEAFKAQEYWTIEGEGAHSAQPFPLKLLEYRGAKVEQFSFTTEAQAREVERTIQAAAGARAARRVRCGSSPSIASSAGAIPRRPSPPRPCSRKRPASSASTRAAPCVSRSSCTRARTSARAASDSLPICAPTRCRSPPKRWRRCARSPRACMARMRSPTSRASTRPSRRTPRKRTRPSARPRRPSRPRTSKARSTTIFIGSTRSSGSARSPRR